jgi:NADH dehydrogenase
VLATLGATSALNRTLIIGGPEPLSWRDVIAKAETIIGRTIEVQSAGPGQAPAGTPAIVGQLLAATEAYDSPIDMTELAYTFGVSLTPVGDVLRSLLQR